VHAPNDDDTQCRGLLPCRRQLVTLLLTIRTLLVLLLIAVQSAAAYSPFTSYALSKLCNTMMAREFQKRFDRCVGRVQSVTHVTTLHLIAASVSHRCSGLFVMALCCAPCLAMCPACS